VNNLYLLLIINLVVQNMMMIRCSKTCLTHESPNFITLISCRIVQQLMHFLSQQVNKS